MVRCRNVLRIVETSIVICYLFSPVKAQSVNGIFFNLTSPIFHYLDNVYDELSRINSNVSEDCRKQSSDLLQAARDGDVSALRVLDSVGKPSSGILDGGVHFLGFYSECISAQPAFGGKYCTVNFNLSAEHPSKELPKESGNTLSGQKPPSLALCVPVSCTVQDIRRAANSTGPLEAELGTISCETAAAGMAHDGPAITTLCVLVFLLMLSLAGTAFDYLSEHRRTFSVKPKENSMKTISQSVEVLVQEEIKPEKESSRLALVLLAFSFRSNGRKIFSVSSAGEGIQCLHGIRLYSMVLIILGHSYSFATQNLYLRNPGAASQAPKDFLSQFFANGTLAVDSFYFISGLLVAYVTLKLMQKTDGKLPLVFFYFHRYFRLTPLFMGVVVFCAYVLRYLGSGPNWSNSILMFDAWCEENGWINALYLHNFIRTENMCLSHSWYLATDMQMYLIVPFILIPLHRNFKYGLIVLGTLMLATIVTTATITAVYHYPAIPYINDILPASLVNAYYKDVYIKPYCRIGPYLVGILAGYFILHNKELHINKVKSAALWVVTVASGLCVIYLMWPANQGRLPSDEEAAAYSALARSVWAAGLAWLTVACHYGYGGFVASILSWRPIVPFSRLTYAAYLIHPVVMNAYYGTFQSTIDFSQTTLLYMFLGNLCITYLISLLLSLLLESPFVALEKLIL